MNTTPITYTPGTVTGGGEVGSKKEGIKATFCFSLNYQGSNFGLHDGLFFQDHKTGLRLASTSFEMLVIDNNHAWFTGSGVVKNGQTVKFIVEVFKAPDTFYIYIPTLDGYEAGGSLAAGSVTIFN